MWHSSYGNTHCILYEILKDNGSYAYGIHKYKKNSGIPALKANPMKRTFPPLFMINLPEEEKVMEELK